MEPKGTRTLSEVCPSCSFARTGVAPPAPQVEVALSLVHFLAVGTGGGTIMEREWKNEDPGVSVTFSHEENLDRVTGSRVETVTIRREMPGLPRDGKKHLETAEGGASRYGAIQGATVGGVRFDVPDRRDRDTGIPRDVLRAEERTFDVVRAEAKR